MRSGRFRHEALLVEQRLEHLLESSAAAGRGDGIFPVLAPDVVEGVAFGLVQLEDPFLDALVTSSSSWMVRREPIR